MQGLEQKQICQIMSCNCLNFTADVARCSLQTRLLIPKSIPKTNSSDT